MAQSKLSTDTLSFSDRRPQWVGLWGQGVLAALGFGLLYTGWLAIAHAGMQHTSLWANGMLGVAVWWVLLLWEPLRRWHCHMPWQLALLAMLSAGLAMTHYPVGGGWAAVGVFLSVLGWAGLVHVIFGHLRSASPPRLPLPYTLLIQLCAIGIATGLAVDFATWARHWYWVVVIATAALTLVQMGPAGTPFTKPTFALTDPSMAVMMGSLVLMNQWCVSLGLSSELSLTLHLLAMAVTQPLLQALVSRHRFAGIRPDHGHVAIISGALLMTLFDTPWGMLPGMVLLSAGSTLSGLAHAHEARLKLFAQVWGLVWLLSLAWLAPTEGPQILGAVLLICSAAWAGLSIGMNHWRHP